MRRITLPRLVRVAALGAVVLATVGAASLPSLAQTAPPPPAAEIPKRGAEERIRREESLKAVQEALSSSADSRRRLEAEIAEIRTDRVKLAASLVETTRQAQATEGRIREVETRLETMTSSELALRRSLDARRGVIVEVLAALQRMGRRPPPAVLVRPEDVLEAIRTSMLLGAVLPELRGEAEVLAGDLAELVRLKDLIAADRATLQREFVALGGERERVAALVAARQAELSEVERSIGAEKEKATDLAGQARNLKDLIERMEAEIASSQRAAEEAKRAATAQARETRERFAAAAFRDPARLTPKIPFVETRGMLPQPVSGDVVRGFGAPGADGGNARGISISARPRAIVSSPSDGWVAFAGPFRSFGRLLIINAGGGYYLLLAGMDRINVDVGQFVLAGEPVGVMGDTSSLLPVAGAIESRDPVLYVEFRKDGGSIDPGPWWAKFQGEKVRG